MKNKFLKFSKYLLLISLFFVIALFYCCKSVSADTTNYDKIFGLNSIKDNLSKKKIDLYEAYILTNKAIQTKKNENKESKKESEYLNKIIFQMQEKAKETYKKKNYEESLKYLLSLKSINQNLTTVTLKDAYNNFLQQVEASDDIFRINALKEEIEENKVGSLNNEYSILKFYYDDSNRNLFLYYYNKYTAANSSLIEKFPSLKQMKTKIEQLNKLKFEELMKSIVTVFHDKGLDYKSGMAYRNKVLGTGFFIDNNGYILTNHHVIAENVDPTYEGYSHITVTTHDNPDDEIPVTVVGYDKVFDIALLKFPKKNKYHLTLGRSDDVKIGDKIYTIGNPLGIKYTATAGIVSNKDYTVFFQLGKGMQIDAAINPGNSGGPLFNERGDVIGIVFAGILEYEGINFAIPIELVNKTIPSLYKGGEVKRSWIGLGIYKKKDIVYCYYTFPSSPAYKSDIKVGDKILSINKIKVSSVEEAQSILAFMRFPQLITIAIERDGKILEKTIKTEERPYLPVKEAFYRDSQKNVFTLIFGVDLEYFEKGLHFKKYKILNIIKGLIGDQLEIGEGDPITIYDLKYTKKSDDITVTIKIKQKDLGLSDRVMSVRIPANTLNTIL